MTRGKSNIAERADGQLFINAGHATPADVMRKSCPTCGAGAGESCRTRSDRTPTDFHRARIRRAGLSD